VSVEIVVTDEFAEWYRGLDDAGSDDVEVAIGVLESRGVSLGAPRSSEIKGTSFALRAAATPIPHATVSNLLRI